MADLTAGQRVRAAREARGLTRERTAVAAGVSVSTVTRLELFDQIPHVRTLAAIAAVVGLDLAELVAVAVAVPA